MWIKHLKDCGEFVSGDGAILREIANGAKENRNFRYSLAHAVVKPGEETAKHRLKTSEAYYIISGQARMFIDGRGEDVAPGVFIDIPPHAVQSIKNTGEEELEFLCIVDPGWRPEDEEIL